MDRVNAVRARKEGAGAAVFLIVVYLWALIATPQYRFEFLGAIHYEKLIVAAAGIALLFSGRMRMRFTGTTVLLLIFYGWLLLSYAASPYPDTNAAQLWVQQYWKLMVFYFLLLFALHDRKDLHVVLAGIVVVSGLYQLHSWWDFVNGGAYVYQQGVRRIIGVWEDGSLGAPNAFGLLAAWTLPFGVYWFRTTERRWVRWGCVGFALMCVASILFSGTRAALAALLFYVLLRYARQLFRPAVVVGAVVLAMVAVALLPPDLKHRYSSTLGLAEQTVEQPGDAIAQASAKSRIEGLKDGFKLALQRPVLGWGPGSSPVARHKVRDGLRESDELSFEDESNLQLHSLYGQVMAESGFVGTGICLMLFLLYLTRLGRVRRAAAARDDMLTNEQATVLLHAFLTFAFYGFASHTLYSFNWLLFFACQAALVDIVGRRPAARPQWAVAATGGRVNASL